MPTVVDVVAATVLAADVADVFGLVGSGNLALANALRAGGANYVGVCHESGAVTMADAYARATGRIGVATVHQGPGFTNTITSLAEAVRGRSPVVLLAAESAAVPLHTNQKLDQASVARSVGAATERIRTAATAGDDVARAFFRARHERVPVVLNLPVDVQRQEVDEVVPGAVPRDVVERPRPADEGVAELERELLAARRPIVVAGIGAAHARAELAALAERTGALLATSARAHGLFRGHPRSLGIVGGFASPLCARVVASADLVVAFGASLNRWSTREGELLAHARVVQVDLDPAAIGRHHPADLGVVGDATATAVALLERIPEPRSTELDALVPEVIAYRRRDEIDDRSSETLIDPRTLMVLLDELLPAERTLAVDSGHFMGWPAMYLDVPDPSGFLLTQGFQSVGLGLATGIGAAVARPDRLAVAVIGDGGARMSLLELETAVRHTLPLLVVVVNDAGYGAEVHDFEPLGVDVELARLGDCDFAAVARGLGAEAATVRTRADLPVLATWLATRQRPLLLDCKVDPTVAGDW